MPNRILKETICVSDNINALTPEQENFFYRLLVQCDDYGRMDARAAVLRAKCFPLRVDSINEQMISGYIKALVKAELIGLYTSEGQKYIQITTWSKHQQIRAKRSKYPEPDSNGNHMISDDCICPRNPIQSNPNPDERRESESENPCETEKRAESPSLSLDEDDVVEILKQEKIPAAPGEIAMACQKFSAEWVKGAIKEAVLHGKPKWTYVAGVLSKCLEEGHAPGEKRPQPTDRASPAEKYTNGKFSHLVNR